MAASSRAPPLIQASLVAVKYSLRRFYQRLKVRSGVGKAIIALAPKFLGIIYRTLKNNWHKASDLVSNVSKIAVHEVSCQLNASHKAA